MDKLSLAQLIAENINRNLIGLSKQWNSPIGTDTKYFIIDDLLPSKIALEIYNAFPKDIDIWNRRKSFRESKYTFAKLDQINSLILDITSAFHDQDILKLINKITNIECLEADPQLYAGGISIMKKGDFLNPHIDNSHDMNRMRYRRLNLLYYITPDWKQANGGNFELWDIAVTKPIEIFSKFNRLIVMETNKKSWHSVSQVLAENERCCISNYYFSNNSPDSTNYYHVTSFLGRPDQTMRRIVGRVDNYLRQCVSEIFNVSRGKNYAREMEN